MIREPSRRSFLKSLAALPLVGLLLKPLPAFKPMTVVEILPLTKERWHKLPSYVRQAVGRWDGTSVSSDGQLLLWNFERQEFDKLFVEYENGDMVSITTSESLCS